MADDPTEGQTDEELQRLRAENIALKRELDAAQGNSLGRRIAVGVLIVIAVISAALGIAATWLRYTILDEETYIAVVEPLPQDEAVASAVATVVVDELFLALDLQSIIEEDFPGPLAALGKPLETALKEFSTDLARDIIQSDVFGTVWVEINRLVHQEAVAVLTGRGDDTVLTDPDSVSLDLGPAVDLVRSELSEAGAGDILPASGDNVVVLFDGQQQEELQTVVNLLELSNWVLPLIALVALGSALLISRNRRRTLIAVGFGIAVTVTLALVVLRLVRDTVVDAPANPTLSAGVAGVWDALLNNLVSGYWAMVVIGLLIAFVAAVAGPSAWAVSVRETVSARVATLRGGESVEHASSTALGPFVERNRTALRLVGVVIAILVVIAWPSLTVGIVVVTVIVLALFLLAIELFREGPSKLESAEVGATEGEGDA